MLQSIVSVASPSQSSPPLEGAGLEQERVRVAVPPPQVTEQEVKLLHSVQFPGAKIVKMHINMEFEMLLGKQVRLTLSL